ncbi:MAG: mannitol-1-phosphate 5-dehydrogenase [Candidatus Firestonebacteria bacterium]
MKKLIQFGAGNIGRGFIAQLFTESGYEVVFVDINEILVNELNKNKGYVLEIVGNKNRKVNIKNVRAVNGRDIKAISNEILTADIMATSVGVNIIKNICPTIAEGIKVRAENNIKSPLNIIICENLLHAGKIMKGYIETVLDKKYLSYLNQYTGFVETVIGRMIPVVPKEIREKDPLYIMAEEFSILPVAKKGFVGLIPTIKNMIACDNFESYEERKLFIHNLGHAICAYLGYLKGYDYIWQSIGDKDIRKIVQGALNETGASIIKKHNLIKKEVDDYIDDLLDRFSNKSLGDTVYRVGRDPVRKLGPNDRLIGSARLVMENGIKPENISTGIAAALHYDYKEDEQAVRLAELIKSQGPLAVLLSISKLKEDDDLTKIIISKYRRL